MRSTPLTKDLASCLHFYGLLPLSDIGKTLDRSCHPDRSRIKTGLKAYYKKTLQRGLTRFGKIRHFGNKLKRLWQFYEGLFRIGHFFLVVNGQILKTIKAIWSHWLDPGSIWLGQNTSNPMGHGTESILLILGIKCWLALKIGRCLCRSHLLHLAIQLPP